MGEEKLTNHHNEVANNHNNHEEEQQSTLLLQKKKQVSVINQNGYKSSRDDPRYGWCSVTPSCIQFMVNKKAFLFIFCVTCVLQGTFHTYFVAVITTLEKLFAIPSRVVGTLLMFSEIGQVSSALFLPYFVGQGHRPRWMAIGSSLFSFATLLCASPHILIPLSLKLQNKQFDSQFCDLNNSSCSVLDGGGEAEQQNPHFILFPIISLSLLAIGLGQTAVYTLGIPFLDDNVATRDSPVYFSITIGVRILGPVLGFVLGSLCTRLYIYPHITPEYDPTDPKWLGAWWLGMVLISGSLLLTSILMYGFPASLKRKRVGDDEGIPKNLEDATAASNSPKLRNFPKTLKRLLTNKILILRTFSCVFHLLPISGLYTFLPKYLESQFRLPAHQANLVTGIGGILVMGVGIFSSGVFIRRREPTARGIALWVAGAAGIYSVGMVALMFVGCGESGGQGLSGVGIRESFSDFSVPLGGDFGVPNCETDKCRKCSPSKYSPVCGADNLVYFSPCHAGCSEGRVVNKTDGDENSSSSRMYTDCECIGWSTNKSFDGELDRTATDGMCPVTCDLFPVYLAIFMVIVLVHSTGEVGSMLLTLRCVESRDKAMALGLIQTAIGIFGNIPCPVIYGYIVDSACIVWDVSGGDCGGEIDAVGGEGKRGHCWVYDSAKFRIYFHGITALLMFVAFLIDVVVVFHANRISIHGVVEGESEEKREIQDTATPKPYETELQELKSIPYMDDDDIEEFVDDSGKDNNKPFMNGGVKIESLSS